MRDDKLHILKRELYRWAKQTLRGTNVKNEQTQSIIEISTQGIDEWYSKSKSEAQIRSILKLKEILAKAVKTHESKNIHSDRKNAPSFEYYECSVEVQEKEYNAVVSVKLVVAMENERRIYYHHYLDEKK
ncbi:hypothetical protein [Treponema berlinense]|uniref:LPD3 domain-containing protein n=1 Tax=Treponema berlinense TaxID=225004 RepID=UPI0026EE2B93|nr:hypothetical protein [Treponema berlinense]